MNRVDTADRGKLNITRTYLIIMSLFMALLLAAAGSLGAISPPEIYYQGEEVTGELDPVTDNGHSLVSARELAEIMGAELEWEPSLEMIDLERGDKSVRLMMGSPYLQSESTTTKTPAPPRLVDETGYVPLGEVVSSFGYLIERQVASAQEESLYIYQPEARLHEIYWTANERRMVFDLDEITPYRVSETDNGEMLIEIDKASLSDNFIDNASNRNFNIRVRESPQESRLQVLISGPEDLPYQRDGGISEQAGNLVLEFLPRLVDISWTEDYELNIEANDELPEPEISLFENPRRLVVDIPEIMKSDIDVDLDDNPYVEDVRLSQFEYDPAVLRVVMDLKDDAFLSRKNVEEEERLVFHPTERTRVSELEYDENMLSFVTNNEISPEIFTLPEPARLVVNMLHTERAEDIPEELDVDGEMISTIRSSKFDSDTTRLVAELEEDSGYSWDMQPVEDGKFLHEITFANELRSLELSEQPGSYGFDIGLSGHVDYEVKHFKNPDRLAVDIRNLDRGEDEVELPEKPGFIEDIRMGRYGREEDDVLRIVLELSEFYGYQVHSSERTDRISLAVERDVPDREEGLIVIDPGHGGFDSGAVAASGLEEKKVALVISEYMSEMLQESGYDVVMTRRGDQFVSLSDRVEIANNTNASLFVSVHSNAAHRNSVGGMETYIAPGREGDSYQLARELQDIMVAELPLSDRGVKSDNFTVIRDTEMPSALLEIGFLSNPEEAELLAQDEFRREAAEAAVEGIKSYLNSNQEGVE